MVGLWLGILGFLALLAAPETSALPEEVSQRATLALAWLMAVWWVTAPVPLAVTSLLPIALLPWLGVAATGEVSAAYANPNIFLYLGGFILALALERHEVHRRVALWTLLRVGTSPARLLLGMILTSAGLSMWISNTAAALILLPLALALADEAERGSRDEGDGRENASPSRFSVALLLAVAYSSSVGGMATPIGTPPNLSLLGIWAELFPDRRPYTTAEWIALMLPLVLVLLAVIWGVLGVAFLRTEKGRNAEATRVRLRGEYDRLGPWSAGEVWSASLFAATALAWVFKTPLCAAGDFLLAATGFAPPDAEPLASRVHDATIVMVTIVPLFVVRVGRDREPVMTWESASRLPWGVLLLFGGGYALADAFAASGLSAWIGSWAGLAAGAPLWLVILGVCLAVTFLTELTSNTATTNILLPVLAGAAPGLGVEPIPLLLAATLSASCAFMLPVATPPNAIVFGSGRISPSQMARVGLALNLVAAAIIGGYVAMFEFAEVTNPGP